MLASSSSISTPRSWRSHHMTQTFRDGTLGSSVNRGVRGGIRGNGAPPLLLLSPVDAGLGSSGLQYLASTGVLIYSDDPAVVMAQREDLEDLTSKWHAPDLL